MPMKGAVWTDEDESRMAALRQAGLVAPKEAEGFFCDDCHGRFDGSPTTRFVIDDLLYSLGPRHHIVTELAVEVVVQEYHECAGQLPDKHLTLCPNCLKTRIRKAARDW